MVLLGNTVTHDTPWDVDQAIGWLSEQARRATHPGDTGWHNRCLGVTALAYGYAGSGTIPAKPGRAGWAIEAWEQAPASTKHATKDLIHSPRGAILHWRGKHGGPGHTGISNGDGRFWTNDLGRDGYITLEPIGDVVEKWGQIPVGWREPLFRHGAGRNPATPVPVPPPKQPVQPKPSAGVTTVVVPTRVRKAPGRAEAPVMHRGKDGKLRPVTRPVGYRVWYRGTRIVVDAEHGRETWLHLVSGNWLLAKRTKRGN